ncbi:hypothetical protein MMC12_002343 [Toensbergia leucococca]|nr:hypothetical protein [Toensbergia leucococca]
MENEASKQPELIALCTVMLLLATLAVLLRCWSISVIPAHRFGFDDFFAILTLPFIISECALIYWWISIGLGRHASTLSRAELSQGAKIIFADAFLYDACISLPKFSALFFYYRIFRKTNRQFYYALLVVGSMNAAWLIAAWISTIFQCVPVRKAWETVEGGHCIAQWSWFLGTAIPSLVIDFCILVMPMPILWRLQMNTSRKVWIMGVFLCGYCVIVVSIGRLVTLAKAGSSLESDLTWSTIPYIEWVQCEGPVSVISVCLPNIFTLGKRVYDHGFRSVLGGASTRKETLGSSDTVDNNGNFIRMDTYPPNRQKERSWSSSEANVAHFTGETNNSRIIGTEGEKAQGCFED